MNITAKGRLASKIKNYRKYKYVDNYEIVLFLLIGLKTF